MSEQQTSVICPGQHALFGEHHDPHYLRVAFNVFYNDGPSNTDFFYLHNYPLVPLSLATIGRLEDFILARLRLHQGFLRVNRAVFLSYMGVPLSADDVSALGWRVVIGDASPDVPAPTSLPPPTELPPEPSPQPPPPSAQEPTSPQDPVPPPAEPVAEQPPATPVQPPEDQPIESIQQRIAESQMHNPNRVF